MFRFLKSLFTRKSQEYPVLIDQQPLVDLSFTALYVLDIECEDVCDRSLMAAYDAARRGKTLTVRATLGHLEVRDGRIYGYLDRHKANEDNRSWTKLTAYIYRMPNGTTYREIGNAL